MKINIIRIERGSSEENQQFRLPYQIHFTEELG